MGVHGERSTYVDERLGSFQEMDFSLGLGPFRMPIQNGLISNTVFVIQSLQG